VATIGAVGAGYRGLDPSEPRPLVPPKAASGSSARAGTAPRAGPPGGRGRAVPRRVRQTWLHCCQGCRPCARPNRRACISSTPGRLNLARSSLPVASGGLTARIKYPADEIESSHRGRTGRQSSSRRSGQGRASQDGWSCLWSEGASRTALSVLQRRELFSGEDLTVMTVYTALLGRAHDECGRAIHVDRQAARG